MLCFVQLNLALDLQVTKWVLISKFCDFVSNVSSFCQLLLDAVCVFVCVELKKEQEEGDEPRAETESESEEELSCFATTVSVFNLSCDGEVSAVMTNDLTGIIYLEMSILSLKE